MAWGRISTLRRCFYLRPWHHRLRIGGVLLQAPIQFGGLARCNLKIRVGKFHPDLLDDGAALSGRHGPDCIEDFRCAHVAKLSRNANGARALRDGWRRRRSGLAEP
jgi:hypothetical protein